MIDRSQSVASLVLEHPECAPVLQRHRIDFCCRGDLSLEAAASQRRLDPGALLAELSRAIAGRGEPAADPRQLSTPQLVEQLAEQHRALLGDALAFIAGLAVKVSRVHGDHQPSLRELEAAVLELMDALAAHLDGEASALFPALASASPDRAALAGTLAATQAEHLELVSQLARVREAAQGFELPDWACNSYRTLFATLQRLEADVSRLVHLENHVLLPRFAAA